MLDGRLLDIGVTIDYDTRMHDRQDIRTLIEPNGAYGYTVAAIVTIPEQAEVEVLYRSPIHLDEKSARGYLVDLRDALANAACLWCAQSPARLIEQIDDLQIFAFDSEACHTEAMKEAHAEEMWK